MIEKMQFTASQIAVLISGQIDGDPDARILSFGKIEEAGQDQLTFLANPKYEDFIYSTKASVVIVNDNLELKEQITPTLIRVPNAYSAFATLLAKYQEMVTQQLTGIQDPSYISKSATVGKNIFVGAFAYIGEGARIADNVKIFPNAYIGNNVVIGYKENLIETAYQHELGHVVHKEFTGMASNDKCHEFMTENKLP